MYSSVLLLLLISCREHQGCLQACRRAPPSWLEQSLLPAPLTAEPSLCWVQRGQKGLERSLWGSVLEDRNKVLQVLPCPESSTQNSLCSPGLSWGQT